MEVTKELIDQSTGEIIEVDALEAEKIALFEQHPGEVPAALIHPFLWKAGRAIRAIYRGISSENPHASIVVIQSEIDRLTAVKQAMIEKATLQAGALTKIAEEAMQRTNTVRVKLDGVGTFRYRKLPSRVVERPECVPFDDLTTDQQADLSARFPNLFPAKTTYRASKTEIKKAIESGETIPHFTVEGGGQKFEFAAEE